MQTEISIRRAALDDIPAIIDLSCRLTAYDTQFDDSMNSNWPKSEDALQFFQERITAHEEGIVLVAICNLQIIAFFIGGFVEPLSYRKVKKLAEIEELFVLEEFRSTKIGSKLMERFFLWCQENGAERIRVTVSAENHRAVSLYKKIGFKDHDLILEKGIENIKVMNDQ